MTYASQLASLKATIQQQRLFCVTPLPLNL